MRQNKTYKPQIYENRAGGRAYEHDPYTKLYSMVCTCLVNEPQYYAEAGELENTILDLTRQIGKKDPEFILKLAWYARNVMNMRSISHVLLGESALLNKGEPKPYVKAWTPHIITRVDDITETLEYVKSQIGNIGDRSEHGSIPQALKEGLQIAFTKFNAYQFGKYKQGRRNMTLKDAIRIVHPKAIDEKQNELFKQVREETVPIPETWETYISKNGSNSETWTHIAPKLPIFALLRNLRNLLQHKVDVNIPKLTNPNVIKNSRILPFRFYSAYKVVNELTDCDPFAQKQVIKALNKAMDLAIPNLEISGRTAVIVDDSASMDTPISSKSTILRNEIGYVLASIANKISPESVAILFGQNAKRYIFKDDSGILTNVDSMAKFAETNDDYIGHSTNAETAIQHLIDNTIKVDRIFLLSDTQCYTKVYGQSLESYLSEYRRNVNNAYFYSMDLAGYGDTPINPHNNRTITISGWSDKIFTYISRFESDGTKVVEEIKNIQLPNTKSPNTEPPAEEE